MSERKTMSWTRSLTNIQLIKKPTKMRAQSGSLFFYMLQGKRLHRRGLNLYPERFVNCIEEIHPGIHIAIATTSGLQP